MWWFFELLFVFMWTFYFIFGVASYFSLECQFYFLFSSSCLFYVWRSLHVSTCFPLSLLNSIKQFSFLVIILVIHALCCSELPVAPPFAVFGFLDFPASLNFTFFLNPLSSTPSFDTFVFTEELRTIIVAQSSAEYRACV